VAETTISKGLGGLRETTVRSPEHVLRYLGRYTHRVAISNHRLISFSDGKVTCSLARFRPQQRTEVDDHYLSMSSCAASCCTCSRKVSCASQLRHPGQLPNGPPPCHFPSNCSAGHRQTQQKASTAGPSDLWSCPKCGGSMMVVERLTTAEIQLRSPPGHRCGMKRLSPIRKCFSTRSVPLCLASERTSFSSSSTTLLTILFRIQLASGSYCHLSHCGQPRQSSPRLLPPLNLHRARVHRTGASFKSLYRKRANTPCSCRRLAPSRFRYNPKTYWKLGRRLYERRFGVQCYRFRQPTPCDGQ